MRNRDMQKALRKARKAGIIPDYTPQERAQRQQRKQERQAEMAGTSSSRPATVEKPWLNPEGYADYTAYNAIRNIEREEQRQREAENKRKRELAAKLIAQGILEHGCEGIEAV